MMEENQPPTKKLKQATLSFFRDNRETSTLKATPLPVPGKKRRNSNSSESPNKSVKLSKPFKILISSDSPNVKGGNKPDGNKPDIREDDVQEVSSSSEAENPSAGKSNTGRCCLMERFVKKVPHDGYHEISSTNNDLDSSLENNANDCDKTKTSDLIVVSDDEVEGKNPVDEKLDSGCDKQDIEKNAETTADINEINVKQETGSSNQSLNTNENKIAAEEETGKLLDTSLSDNCGIKMLTSTPLKPESSCEEKSDATITQSFQQSPVTPATSSGKKKGRKVDSARKTEKEALKEKLKQEREEQRLERKRKLDEAKSEKEKKRKEQQEIKEKARQELLEKQKQERLEKEKSKEEARQKREEEKSRKDEEKQKKLSDIENKQEDKRRKEEEKRRKEDEKLKEEELKTKQAEKLKTAFKSFFTKQTAAASKMMPVKTSAGLFIPFELKKDMHLAPTLWRDPLTDDKKSNLDQFLSCDQTAIKKEHYLDRLQSGMVKPHRTGRILRKNPQPPDEMDLEIIHDSEALKKVFHKVKLLQFHTDHRPPYYGTWRKESKLSPSNPFKKDEDVFDYEVDSDEEWEEEEPGESLSCSDGEDDKAEENEEEEEDGWMVPHGYLSEDEGCNEDDEITPEKLKLQQQAKAKAWEEEQKRKLHATPMIVVGCFFEHCPSEKMSGDVRLLYQYKAVVLTTSTPIPTSLTGNLDLDKGEEPVADVSQVTPTPKGPKRQCVPDEAMPDLIRLVHGNICGVKKLVKEFRVFWLCKCNSTASKNSVLEEACLDESFKDKQMNTSGPNDSLRETSDTSKLLDDLGDNDPDSADKSKEEGHGCEISKRQLEKKIMIMAVREKRPACKKTAWYVHDSILADFKMSDIELPNTWEYLTTGPSKSPAPNPLSSTTTTKPSAEAIKTDEVSDPVIATPKDQRSIMDFALSKKELESRDEKPTSSTLEKPVTLVRSKENKLSVSVDKKGCQKSIVAFASSKKELGDSAAAKNISGNSSVTNLAETVKEFVTQPEKKANNNNQRSIMDFALSNKGNKVDSPCHKSPDNSSVINLKATVNPQEKIVNNQKSIICFAKMFQAAVPEKATGLSTEGIEVIEIDDETSLDSCEVSTTQQSHNVL